MNKANDINSGTTKPKKIKEAFVSEKGTVRNAKQQDDILNKLSDKLFQILRLSSEYIWIHDESINHEAIDERALYPTLR